MIYDITKLILDVGKSLFGFRNDLAKASRERRDRMADYFDEIARLIEDVSVKLKKNEYPHGSCAKLEALAQLMPETLKNLLDEKEIEKNKEKLLSVYEIERLFGELQDLSPEKSAAKLRELDEAGGKFSALAAHLKVSN